MVWINAALHPVARASVPLDCPIAPNAPASDADTIGSHFGNGGGFDPESAVAPVAYRYVHRNYAGQKINIYGDHPVRVNGALPEETHPLYAHPPHPAPVDPVAGGEALAGAVMAEVVDNGRWSLRFDFGAGDQAMRDMRSAADMFRALAALKGPAA